MLQVYGGEPPEALNVWVYKPSTVAGGTEGGEIVSGGGPTTMVGFSVTVFCGDELSVARTVMGYIPVAVGVPKILAVAPFVDVSPGTLPVIVTL
jgi:hypothetical protein